MYVCTYKYIYTYTYIYIYIYPLVGNSWDQIQLGSETTGAYDICRICPAYATAYDICGICLLRICHMPHMRLTMSMTLCELLRIGWNWFGLGTVETPLN